jgi:hypothetical protein
VLSGETPVIEVHSYRVFLIPAMRYGDRVQSLDPVIFLYDATDRFFARLHFSREEDLNEP